MSRAQTAPLRPRALSDAPATTQEAKPSAEAGAPPTLQLPADSDPRATKNVLIFRTNTSSRVLGEGEREATNDKKGNKRKMRLDRSQCLSFDSSSKPRAEVAVAETAGKGLRRVVGRRSSSEAVKWREIYRRDEVGFCAGDECICAVRGPTEMRPASTRNEATPLVVAFGKAFQVTSPC